MKSPVLVQVEDKTGTSVELDNARNDRQEPVTSLILTEAYWQRLRSIRCGDGVSGTVNLRVYYS